MDETTPTPPPPPEEPAASGTPSGPSKDEKTMAMICHLLGLGGLVIAPTTYLPFVNIVGPLILWMIKKDSMPFVNDQGKEALNFQITISIGIAICIATWWLLVPIAIAFAIGLAGVVFAIIAAVKAGDGHAYRYPWTLRLIK